MIEVLRTGKLPKYYIWVFLLILMPFQIWGYLDEVIAAICIVYLIIKIIRKQLPLNELRILVLLGVLILVGLISNVCSHINVPIGYVLTDALWLSKTFVVFIGFRNLFKGKKYRIASAMLTLSKCVIIFMFCTSILTQFVDIGMTIEVRYGISSYGFIWKNGIQTAWLLCGCLACVIIAESNNKKCQKYIFMSCVVCFLTTKGTVWVLPFTFIILSLISRNNYKLSFKKMIPIALILLIASGYQIQTYLLNDESIRYRLIYYGFVTANTYFPLGSGFATYGSDFAVRNYSELYYRYGFNNMWGLSKEDPLFLNDNYLGMVVGQFGYFGLILFLVIMIKIFKIVNISNIYKTQKFWALAIYFTIAVSMIASATAKSCMGVFATIFLALLTIEDGEKYET